MSVKLISSDGCEIIVAIGVAKMSTTIRNMIESVEELDSSTEHSTDDVVDVPLPNVMGDTLKTVIEWCKYHHENPEPKSEPTDEKPKTCMNEISPWDKNFVPTEQKPLFDLILAANYLDIKPLLEITCKTVANMIKGKTPEEIRKTFNIENDFTLEEEEAVRKENEW